MYPRYVQRDPAKCKHCVCAYELHQFSSLKLRTQPQKKRLKKKKKKGRGGKNQALLLKDPTWKVGKKVGKDILEKK